MIKSMKDIGHKIRFQRQLAGKTQAQLGAVAFNLSESAGQSKIKNFELQTGRTPTIDELRAICKVLHITEKELDKTSISDFSSNTSVLFDPKILEIYPQSKDYYYFFKKALKHKDLRLFLFSAKRWLAHFEVALDNHENKNRKRRKND